MDPTSGGYPERSWTDLAKGPKVGRNYGGALLSAGCRTIWGHGANFILDFRYTEGAIDAFINLKVDLLFHKHHSLFKRCIDDCKIF